MYRLGPTAYRQNSSQDLSSDFAPNLCGGLGACTGHSRSPPEYLLREYGSRIRGGDSPCEARPIGLAICFGGEITGFLVFRLQTFSVDTSLDR
jgi:hypothetical protein